MLLSISILRNSRSFTVFSVTPLSILTNCSSVNSRPATAAAERSMSFVNWGAAAVSWGAAASDAFVAEGFAPDSSARGTSDMRSSVNFPQSTPGKSVEVKPSEEKYARNERRSVVRLMSRETFCTAGGSLSNVSLHCATRGLRQQKEFFCLLGSKGQAGG